MSWRDRWRRRRMAAKANRVLELLSELAGEDVNVDDVVVRLTPSLHEVAMAELYQSLELARSRWDRHHEPINVPDGDGYFVECLNCGSVRP